MTALDPFPPTIEPHRRPTLELQHCFASNSNEVQQPFQSISEFWDDDKSFNHGFISSPRSQPRLTSNSSKQPFRINLSPDNTPRNCGSSMLCQDSLATDDSIYQKVDGPLREGRAFTVSKVGNNGKIYLRPSIRPTNELNPQSSVKCPPIKYPVKISSFAGRRASLDSVTCASCIGTHRSIFTSMPPRVNSIGQNTLSSICYNNNINDNKSINDNDEPYQNHNPLYFPIPSYELGSPHFSIGGTPFLKTAPSRRHSDSSCSPYLSPTSHLSLSYTQATPTKSLLTNLMIKPEVYDILTLEALHDHPSVVRYSGGGQISAATPIRLVAEITSPKVMDYDLLSSFFLTFRSFLETAALMHMLFARLEWSLLRLDSVGLVVSVRTFVAIRHWILNYFWDDFLDDWELRRIFCNLVNDFVNKLKEDPTRFKVALKTLGELKKCWIKACGAYWKCPEFTTDQFTLTQIDPVGIAESDHSDPNMITRMVNQTNQLSVPNMENTFPSSNIKSKIDLDHKNTSELKLPQSPITTTTILINNTLQKIPLSPGSMISTPAISYKVNDQKKDMKMDNHSVIHLKPVKSILDMKKGFSAAKKANRSNEDHQNYPKQNHESSREKFQFHQPDQENTLMSYLQVTPAVESNSSSNKIETSREPQANDSSPYLLNELSEHACVSYPPPNSKESNVSPGPGIKRLFGNLRRAIGNRTDQTINSSRTQKCMPNLLHNRARVKPARKIQNSENAQFDNAYITSLKGPERYDLLSVKAAKELECINHAAHDNVDIRPLKYSTIHPDENKNTKSHTEASILLSPNTQFSETTSQASPDTKLVVANDSSLKSFAISDFSSHSSNDSSVTACMRALGGPTPPKTPDILFTTSSSVLNPLGIYGVEKTPPIEETPSLFVDSYLSEDEKSRLQSSRTREFKQSPSDLSFETQTSLQLHPPYPSSLKKWKSNPSFDISTLSDDEIKTHQSYLNHPTLSLHFRPLRRRPGGYLRSVNYPDHAEIYSNPRRMSGSFCPTEFTPRSGQNTSTLFDETSVIYGYSEKDHPKRSFSRMTEHQPRSPIIPLGSSIFTGSFEKEVRFLAQLPDIEGDDGTVEAALLKLEGKFAKPMGEASELFDSWSSPALSSAIDTSDLKPTIFPGEEVGKRKNRKYVLETTLKASTLLPGDCYHPKLTQEERCQDINNYESRDVSSNCIDRPDSHDVSSNTLSSDDNVETGPYYNRSYQQNPHGYEDILSPIGFSSKSDLSSNGCNRLNSKLIESTVSNRKSRRMIDINSSFLLTESDNECGNSSNNHYETFASGNNIITERVPEKEGRFLTHTPNIVTKEFQDPPIGISIPHVIVSQVDLIPELANENGTAPFHVKTIDPKNDGHPPTPNSCNRNFKPHRATSISPDPLRINRISDTPRIKATEHLPFILAFSSDNLVQQFTLVEKEILSEIKWRDLVEMKWKDSSIDFNATSWVKLLNSYNHPRGIEAIITRYKLMIRWVVSECVLTTDMSERVCCLIKFIHIADKSRKYRNFATMGQIVTALMSQDIARLTKTWEHVPSPEIQTFQKLASLLDKSNDYYRLRAEMESISLDYGCIPLVQIYTHELLSNCCRPVCVKSSSKAVPLINYQRYHANAIIIKSLLRLLDSIQNYKFHPNESVIQRCYWISALSDEQISVRTRLIQP